MAKKKSRNKKSSPKKAKTDKATEQLKSYVKLMELENLHELEISDGQTQIKLVKQGGPVAYHVPQSSAAPARRSNGFAPAKEDVAEGVPIKSPIAGVFYRAASPNASPFVSEGDNITKGQVLCIIEAMKVMNEITADKSGKLIKIVAENGKPIETGQVLFKLEG